MSQEIASPSVIDASLSQKLANMGFVCACLIVSMHVVYVPEGRIGWWIAHLFTGYGIGNVAVPYYFVASGFFLAGHLGEGAGWWGREVRKRLRTLVVPYLFWNLFYWLYVHGLSFALRYMGITFAQNSNQVPSLGLDMITLPELSYLWFVRCLIVFVLVAPLFLVFRFRRFGLVVLCAILIASFLPLGLDAHPDWHVNFARQGWLKGSLYFSLGVWLRWHPIRASVIGRWPYKIILVLLAFFPWWMLAMIENGGDSGVLRVMNVCLPPVSLLAVWLLVPHLKWPRILTTCAFPVFLLHSAVITIIIGVLKGAGVKEMAQSSCAAYFVEIFVVITLSSLIAIGLKKIPRVSAFIFGGR